MNPSEQDDGRSDSQSALSDYYSRRAREYEQIYTRDDPVRQSEQTAIAAALRVALRGRRVLEVACGTGYWTSAVADVARHIVATDVSNEMLAIARGKPLAQGRVEFLIADAYELHDVPGRFNAAMALFWLSHVPKARLNEFLEALHCRLEPEAIVFLADNVYLPDVGGELVRRPGCEDTFKRRVLADGSEHEIIKNYYDASGLRELLGPHATELDIHVGRCFWWLSYRVSDAERIRGRRIESNRHSG